MQGQNKAEQVASNTKVNVAMTKNDSIFPDLHLPGGISSKATEYKDLALKGDNWESPVFKLGSAPTSSNIAAAPAITRKEHSVTGGGVKGPQNIGNTGSTTNQLRNPAAQTAGQSGANGSITNNTAGFSNQVDQAFSRENTNGLNGNRFTNGHTNGYTNGKTTLGANNAVLTGPV